MEIDEDSVNLAIMDVCEFVEIYKTLTKNPTDFHYSGLLGDDSARLC